MNKTRKIARLIAIATIPALLAALWMLSSPADAEGDYTTTTIESTTTTTAPVPQALVNVEASTVCVEGTAMVITTISNDYDVPVFVDITVNGETRAGLLVAPFSETYSEFPLDTSTPTAGTLSLTVTYEDGGLGVFPIIAEYEAIDCPTPAEIGDALTIERSDVYVTPPSTVPAPVSSLKPLRFAG